MSRRESKPGIIAHTLAVIASVLAVVGMWAYSEQMMRQKSRWEELSTELSQVEELQIVVAADILVNYGYIILPLTFAVVYGLTLAIASAVQPKHHEPV